MIALIQPNIGNFDAVAVVPEQSIPYDYLLYAEPPFPLSEFNNRMKARFIKLQHHRFLDHDIFIFIDGRAEIISNWFVSHLVELLIDYDLVITKHPERETVGEEYDFMMDWMDRPETKAGKYLLDRYNPKVLAAESKLIDPSLPLYACGVFAWKITDTMQMFFDEWWMKCIEYSAWEQCWLSQLINDFNINVCPIGYDLVKINKHK